MSRTAQSFPTEEIKSMLKEVKSIPIWLQYVVAVATILGTIGTIFGVWGAYVLATAPRADLPASEQSEDVATSSISISALLAKANNYDTDAESYDFLEKYIDTKITGQGVVSQVGRTGQGFLLDITIPTGSTHTLLTCSQEGSQDNERKFLLLKNKIVKFEGIFRLVNVFGHGLEIGECKLLI